jgi:hypothetical protein
MPVINVIGTAASLTWEGKAIRFWETYEFKGEKKFRVWTAWGTNQVFDFAEGDTISVEGDLSTKVGTYIPKDASGEKTVVEHSLNNITVKLLAKAEKREERETPAVDEELPF